MLEHATRRCILRSGIAPDPYLNAVAARTPSHRFLGRATQGCYLRMVHLLVEHCASDGKQPHEVSVLDWGAGKGHISYLLREAGFRVTSCDIVSENDDSTFHQQAPIVVEKGLKVVPLRDPFKLPFGDCSFDLVVSFGVLEHVPQERESLGEIHRVLKPNGTFFFCFLPYWLSWTQRLAHLRGNSYHDRLYTKRGVQAMLTSKGFKLRSIWHGQLLPKNSLPTNDLLERLDRFLTELTPLKYFATNLEGFATRV